MNTEIALPPEEYMHLVCGPKKEGIVESFNEVGASLARNVLLRGMAETSSVMLDIGCGCGRLARNLLDSDIGRYEGFDRHSGMIKWCQENITTVDDRFNFQHVNVASPYDDWDGIKGTVSATELTFPYSDNEFTSCLLSSVFTHMHLDECERYLHEIHRVLKHDGLVFLSIFITEKPFYREAGQCFFHTQTQVDEMFARTGFRGQQRAHIEHLKWIELRPTSTN